MIIEMFCWWRIGCKVGAKNRETMLVWRYGLMVEGWMQGPRPKYGEDASLIPGGRAFIIILRPVFYILCVSWKSTLLGPTSDQI
jgi:hypothetical protein